MTRPTITGKASALPCTQSTPTAYIAGEEWGNASSWLLGGEWDATMNYQFSSAMLSFWRDEAFIDNDHNSGSSAGVIDPLTPSAARRAPAQPEGALRSRSPAMP